MSYRSANLFFSNFSWRHPQLQILTCARNLFCKYDLAIKQSILYWSSCFDFNIQSIRVILLKSLISKKLLMQLRIARMPKMSLKSPKCSPSKIVGDSTPVLKFENNQNDFLCFSPGCVFYYFFVSYCPLTVFSIWLSKIMLVSVSYWSGCDIKQLVYVKKYNKNYHWTFHLFFY